MPSDARFITMFYEPEETADLARREGLTIRQLKDAWVRLRHMGRLPRKRHGSFESVETRNANDEHAFDGRPKVDVLENGDPLLEVLRERGHAYAEDDGFVDKSPAPPKPVVDGKAAPADPAPSPPCVTSGPPATKRGDQRCATTVDMRRRRAMQ